MARLRTSTRELEEKFSETAFRLSQERSDFLLPQILDFVRKDRWINVRPEYQRRSVWDVKKRSLFIESLLLNIPVPPVFLFEKALSRYEVMDGQQRLNAIVDFYENGFALRGLVEWSELNGARFRDLPEVMQRGLDRRRISATVLLAESTRDFEAGKKDIRKLVFERLNQGGKTLNSQELRNCLFAGCFNDLLSELASEKTFTDVWAIPSYHEHLDARGVADEVLRNNALYKRMQDCQIVLRYFAFREKEDIKGSVRSMLDEAMEKRVGISESEAMRLGIEYRDALNASVALFGTRTFSLRSPHGKWKPSIALYDGVMYAVSRHLGNFDKILQDKQEISVRLQSEMEKASAYELMVGRANTSATIVQRLELIERVIVG